LAELLVSGRRGGRAAALFAVDSDAIPIDPRAGTTVMERALKLAAREKGVRPITLRNRLRHMMWEKAGVFRSHDSLDQALQALEEIEQELTLQSLAMKTRHYNQELIEGLENYFLVQTARCIVTGALERTESRGAHFREDFPQTDNENWLEHLVLYQRGDKIEIEKMPVDLREMRPTGESE
jgi:succinate dehydrogenase/fumarate reductase flavoprotein subunit